MHTRIVDRRPELDGRAMAASLVPPRQFADATLQNYRPDPDYPSQAEAVAAVLQFAADWTARPTGLFRRGPKAPERPGLYLDGGFGVGKTHLLAALWSLAPGRKYFGTFIEYTALIGALGYADAVALFRGASLVAIDEFELDDPGDTMLMSRFLGALVESGTRIAATSNTPPNALGDGRFAAQDFLREIQALADRFRTVRIDGLDYRRRAVDGHAVVVTDAVVESLPETRDTTVDDFGALLGHLASVHPARYIGLIDGVRTAGLLRVTAMPGQTEALRLVALVDRLYDAQVRIVASGVPLDAVFGEEMLNGGYRKKYLRAMSRLIAMTTEGAGALQLQPDAS